MAVSLHSLLRPILHSPVNWSLLCLSLITAIVIRFVPLPFLFPLGVSSTALFSISVSHPPSPQLPNASYVVLIDGGSSGSRVHVHSYTLPAWNASTLFPPLPVIAPSASLKIKPGLSAFTSPSAAAQSLLPLLSFALEHVPRASHSSTPIFLYATAGLRTVPLPEAEAILAECRALLSSHPFAYSADAVRIISGVQEGINGWIAANYLLKHFDSAESSFPSATIGVLEMGGASFQLTYAPQQPEGFPPSTLIPLTIGQRSYLVYTVSYLNYGLEKAQELYAARHSALLSEADPCYPVGARGSQGRKAPRGDYAQCVELIDQLIRYDLLAQQRDAAANASGLLPAAPSQQDEWEHPTRSASTPSSSTPPSTLHDTAHHESGHVIDCSSSAQRCSFSGRLIPPIGASEQFLAIENFYYTHEFFDLLPSSPSLPHGLDVDALRGKGREYCRMTWDEIEGRWPREPKEDLDKYCFSAAYLPRVLEVGLGMGRAGMARTVEVEQESVAGGGQGGARRTEVDVAVRETLSVGEGRKALEVDTDIVHSDGGQGGVLHNVRITKHINGVAIDWALGAVLLEITNHLHADLYGRKAEALDADEAALSISAQ